LTAYGVITSEANGIVKLAKKLRDKRGRDSEDAFLIEGDNLLKEAYGSKARVTHILLRESKGPSFYDEVADLFSVRPRAAGVVMFEKARQEKRKRGEKR
jgi:tRNA G18 (ribose-2'-O)-methylase SpoU